MILFQFIGDLGPYTTTGVLVIFYFLLDRRLRRVENHLAYLNGSKERVKKKNDNTTTATNN